MENSLKRFVEEFGNSSAIVSIYLYKIGSDKNDFIEWILWVDKDAHDTLVSQPEFPATYQALLDLLTDEPTWYSGEIAANIEAPFLTEQSG
jgi:hypothetical protein